ncbi:MAG: MBL fold metallo-hydrolase [Gammaproteobacteria bacterium]|nr:MBL fold metallo-hydrolase [Gammaproteobacteria bacterium]
MAIYRYAAYPEAKVYDASKSRQINHLLFGDWVRVEGDVDAGWVPVHVRGTDGFMREDTLQEERTLEVVFTDVGQGDGCLLVTPGDKHFVIDAGISDNMYRFLKWRYGGFRKKWTFEAAIISHPDQDHYGGFEKFFTEPNVHFNGVYHNGIMEERTSNQPLGPIENIGDRKFLIGLIERQNDLAAFLADTPRWRHPQNAAWDKKYPSLLNDALTSGRVGNIEMLARFDDADPFLPGYSEDQELSIEILGPVVERDGQRAMLRAFGETPQSKSFDAGKTKNGHSVILLVRYRDVRLLLGGDLNTAAEVFLMQQYAGIEHDYPWTAAQQEQMVHAARPFFEADIAKACHHGSSDFTDAFIRTVNAAATVISSGDEESHAHPRPDTLGALGLHGRGARPLLFCTELMRSTREDEGSLEVEIGRLRERLAEAEGEEDAAEVAGIRALLDAHIDKLLERNVTVYGSINLRTDGQRTIMAYKLERERRYANALEKWDIYRLEAEGNGPVVYKPEK